jgi:hypothetical protein
MDLSIHGLLVSVAGSPTTIHCWDFRFYSANSRCSSRRRRLPISVSLNVMHQRRNGVDEKRSVIMVAGGTY